MTVSRDVKDGIADTGIALVRREGIIGFAAIFAAILIVAFMWQTWRQTEVLVEVLQKSQELQRDTLEGNKILDEVLARHAKALEELGSRSYRAAENLDRLVAIMLAQTENNIVWQSKDDNRAAAILKRLDAVAKAAGLSAEETRLLRKTVKRKTD